MEESIWDRNCNICIYDNIFICNNEYIEYCSFYNIPSVNNVIRDKTIFYDVFKLPLKSFNCKYRK